MSFIQKYSIYCCAFLLISESHAGGGDYIFKNTFELCELDLTTISAGETFAVSCDLDLSEETIVLASDVVLEEAGGSIRNGTLEMDGGAIDGELLNTTVEIEGDTSLISSVFLFRVERWDVIQHEISQSRAIANKDEMNEVISLVKRLGATEFRLDHIDAYFYGDHFEINATRGIERNAIRLPSDFKWVMSDHTILRLQPSHTNGKLLGILNDSHVTISGGTLIGDREDHDYSPVEDIFGNNRDTHEYSFLIHLAGAHDIVIDDVNLLDSSGDGLFVGSSGLRRPDGTIPPGVRQTQNVVVKNSLIKNNRRNNISLVDGEFITLDNNIISDAGGGEQITEEVPLLDEDGNPVLDEDGNPVFETVLVYSSAGTYPRAGIDMEAWRVRIPETGELIEYERISEVTIINNQFLNNEVSDLILFTTSQVLVDNNYFTNGISSVAAQDIEIRHNVFENASVEFDPASIGIIFTSRVVQATGEELNYNFDIHNNQISGFDNGVVLGGNNIAFYDNTVTDFSTGIRIVNLEGGLFADNVYESAQFNSRGVWGFISDSQDALFFNETIDVQREPFLIDRMNQNNANGQVTFDSCFIDSSGNFRARIANSNRISVINSELNREVELTGTNQDIVLQNNTIINN